MKQHLTMKEAVALALELEALVRLEQAVLTEHPPLPEWLVALARKAEALGADRRARAAARVVEAHVHRNEKALKGES